MAAGERLYLYWDPAIDGAFRRRLERALGNLKVDTADGETVDPDPEKPGVVMALASAAGAWPLPARTDIIVQAGPGDFPHTASALRLYTADIETTTARWSRFLDKLRNKLGMASLALPAEDLSLKLDEVARRADDAETAMATARLNESNAIRDKRQMEVALAEARKRIADLETSYARLQTVSDSGAYALGLVPADMREAVASAREHAWRAEAAAARATEMAAAYPNAIAWGHGASYSGEHRNGRPDGHGVMTFGANGHARAYYRGQFAAGRRTGHGIGQSDDGLQWSGEWKNNEACGLGLLEAGDGRRFEGAVTPNANGAPSADRGWTWRLSAAAPRTRIHTPVAPQLPAPHAAD